MLRWTIPAVALAVACGGTGESGEGRATPAEGALVSEVASPAGPGAGEPFLHATTGGRVLLSWIEPAEPDVHTLRFAEWTGDGWGAPRTIARGRDWFVNWADFPSIVELPDGSLVAHWLARTGAGTYAYEVQVARSDDGGATWSAPVVPHRDATETEHGFVSLFAEPEGAVGAVWLDGRKYAGAEGHEPPPGAEMTVRYARIGVDGEVAGDTLLDGRACDCCQTDVALTSRGVVVAYRDRSPEEIRDIAVVRRVDGRWTEPAVVHADGWEISACPVNGPAAAASGERVAVAWFTAARDTAHVRVAFSDDAGATFRPPISVDDGAPIGRVDLALLPDGTALVAWLERAGAEAEIRVRRVAPDGAAGPSTRVAVASEARAGGFPRMAVAGDRALFAWTRPGEPAEVRVAVTPVDRFPVSR